MVSHGIARDFPIIFFSIRLANNNSVNCMAAAAMTATSAAAASALSVKALHYQLAWREADWRNSAFKLCVNE